MKIDSIIFDLDGTLWNFIEGVCGAWTSVLAKKYPQVKRVITPVDMEACMGLQIKEIGKKLFADLDEDFHLRLMKECCETEQVYLGEHGGI